MALLLFVGVGTSVTMAEADTPTAISLDKDGLIALSQEVSNGDNKLGKNYVLGADVDLTGVEFAPIGTDLVRFQGNIDGNGKKITLSQSVTGSVAGVFGYLGSSGGVRNLIVDGTIDATGDNVGGLVAYNEGVVSACVSLVQDTKNNKQNNIIF